MFDWDRFSKNDPLGEVKLGLAYFDLARGVTEWRQLQSYSGKVSQGSSSSRSDLFCCQPSVISQSIISTASRTSTNSIPRKDSLSSSDDEKKVPAGPTGPPRIRYQISYDRNYQSLRVTVAQCQVSHLIPLLLPPSCDDFKYLFRI